MEIALQPRNPDGLHGKPSPPLQYCGPDHRSYIWAKQVISEKAVPLSYPSLEVLQPQGAFGGGFTPHPAQKHSHALLCSLGSASLSSSELREQSLHVLDST